jgi:hypothetical protein
VAEGATDDIRNERLAPLVEQARTIWRMLRQESNVAAELTSWLDQAAQVLTQIQAASTAPASQT